jgi:dolichol-phosphate mannosyltransferase
MDSVTVIVPTWEEASNIDHLVGRLSQSLSDRQCRVLFVDDSPTSDTVDAIDTAAARYTTPVFQVSAYRRNGQAWGGLGGAVTDGLRRVNTPFAAVMDADLQHEPELLPRMLEVITQGSDLVIASRYCEGGSSEGLSSPLRHFVSLGSTYVAKLLFPMSLRGVTDPMTGFYALRLSAIDPLALQPLGFKILLETLVRHSGLKTQEVPMHFAARHSGTSKASFTKGLAYIRHLLRLRLNSWKHAVRQRLLRLRYGFLPLMERLRG